MTREEALERFENIKANALVQKASGVSEYWQNEIDGTIEAIDMAIEELSKPNYESDTEVRLAVTDRNKDKVVLWDAFGEEEYYPQTTSHGRPIDADALYTSIAKDTYLLTDRINSRDYGMFLVGIKQKIDEAPTVQADRPHGEWVKMPNGNIECSECRHQMGWYENFCGFCGADMRKEKE